MKNILALCFFPAFTPPTNGGQSRIFNFYRALSSHHRISLLTSTHLDVAEEKVVHGINFIERRVPKDRYFIEKWQQWSPLGSGGDMSAPTIAASSSRPTLLHKAYLEEYDRADIIIHDFPFLEGYDIFCGLDDKLRVYNSHNCETKLYRQLHPDKRSVAVHQLVADSERTLLHKVDLVLYCNDADLEDFRVSAPNASFRAHYAPNGTLLGPQHASPTEPGGGIAIKSAVFMGSSHPPNTTASLFIARQLAPCFPEIEFRFIGSCLPDESFPANVRRFGVVSDARKHEILQGSDIALNPMAEGSGSNVKVLDYFSHSLPVLSTEFGMRGIHAIDGQHYVAASLGDFETTFRRVAQVADSLRDIGAAGRTLAEEKYGWKGIADSTAKLLSSMSDAKRANPPSPHLLVLNDYDSFNTIGGGGTRTRGLCAALSKHQRVAFVSFSASGEIAARAHSENVIAITVPKSQAHLDDEETMGAVFHVSCVDIVASRHCTENWLLDRIYQVLRRNASMVVAEHCYMAPIPMRYGDRFIYSSQNAETALKRRLLEGHPMRDMLLEQVRRLETRTVRQAAATVVVCEEDANILLNGASTSGSMIVIRNGAEMPPPNEQISEAIAGLGNAVSERSVVFVGSAHVPNIECATFIRDRLAMDCPAVEFHIVGSVCSALGNVPFVPSNVRLWGVVDELRKAAIMQQCAVAINPMTSGGGSNIKLADYLASGLFVVSTEFGQRGYPPSIRDHVLVAPINEFKQAIERALGDELFVKRNSRSQRRALFAQELSMNAIGEQFAELLRVMERPKARVLFVTYRYVSPASGGAEATLEDLIKTLGESGDFLVDVVAPEVSAMHNVFRFSERYDFNEKIAIKNVPNLRHIRFPLDEDAGQAGKSIACLSMLWQAQVVFEKELSRLVQHRYRTAGLAWGWGDISNNGEAILRWAFASCGLYAERQGHVSLGGTTDKPVFVCAFDETGAVLASMAVEAGGFILEFHVSAPGVIEVVTSRESMDARIDPRPLGFRARSLEISGHPIDLSQALLAEVIVRNSPSEISFRLLAAAAKPSRFRANTRLTDARGPFSSALEAYIEDNVHNYDLVVTHNNIFRPAVFAMDAAKRKGVPAILWPHSHFDDDYYHFPDVLQSAQSARLVLAAPKAACDFLSEQGCDARYLPNGIDTAEPFTTLDIEHFRKVHSSAKPFVLVLGRKAGAKNYKDVIAAVEQFNGDHGELDVVLIGPDDDGVKIDSPVATYLGRQPREVVRGALISCLTLVNMSSSESFGIVLLEAWLAGTAVIANKQCAAFHDIAVDESNALLVEKRDLKNALLRLHESAELRTRLAQNGRKTAAQYDSAIVRARFIEFCHEAMGAASI